MKTSAQDIYQSILQRAADEWNIEYEDIERDVGQSFDPLVRFMAGGMASELEKVHHLLDETEGRLQERLAKVLLPEYYHLPQPAHALARIQPSDDPLIIDETTAFETVPKEEDNDAYNFTPLFPSRLLPLRVKVIATEENVVAANHRSNKRRSRRKPSGEKEETRRILIGFAGEEFPENIRGTSLYLDLAGAEMESGERTQFLASFAECTCWTGKEQLIPYRGLPQSEMLLEDFLNGNERLHKTVTAYYEKHFLTFSEEHLQEIAPESIQRRLSRWFAQGKRNNGASEPESSTTEEQINALPFKPEDEFFWLEIRLSRSLEIHRLAERIRLQLNVFPIVNRELNGHRSGEHYFLRKSTIKWIHIQPEHSFLAIRNVYIVQSPEKILFTYKPFADFREDKSPAYTIRYGGVGRWDEFNAWKRLAYLVGVLQENYAKQELIQEATNNLSLEQVHQLLGKKIKGFTPNSNPTRNVYILLHTGLKTGVQARVEYWTSRGEEANGVSTKNSLRCVSREASSFEKESGYLITSTTGGRRPLQRTEQLEAMKSSILSRGRIVTREDVKTYCRDFLRDKVVSVVVKDGVGHDPRYNFGMTRMLDVIVKPARASRKEDWSAICYQLRTLLEQKSSSNIPIRVTTERGFESEADA